MRIRGEDRMTEPNEFRELRTCPACGKEYIAELKSVDLQGVFNEDWTDCKCNVPF